MFTGLRNKLRRFLTRKKSARLRKAGVKCMEVAGGYPYKSHIAPYIDAADGASAIRSSLASCSPFMAARVGAVELTFINRWRFEITEEGFRLSAFNDLCNNAGFFPQHEPAVDRFIDIFLESASDIDIFCAWNFRLGLWAAEQRVFSMCKREPTLTDIRAINQFAESQPPWSIALEGKKVLVISPFAESIRRQYERREQIFPNSPEVLPKFESLETICAVQSIANTKTEFDTWFDALEFMKTEMDKLDFDVVLIGAGAYGIPLASYAKQLGKQAIQMGGMTQVLFGIYGRRWENKYKHLINDAWVRPLPSETPSEFKNVENGCYW